MYHLSLRSHLGTYTDTKLACYEIWNKMKADIVWKMRYWFDVNERAQGSGNPAEPSNRSQLRMCSMRAAGLQQGWNIQYRCCLFEVRRAKITWVQQGWNIQHGSCRIKCASWEPSDCSNGGIFTEVVVQALLSPTSPYMCLKHTGALIFWMDFIFGGTEILCHVHAWKRC